MQSPPAETKTVETTGIMEIVLKAMHKHPNSEDLQGNGCGALGSLLFQGSSKERLVTKLDGLTTIAAAMKTLPGNARLQGSGCVVISILSKLPELKDHLIEAGCVELTVVAFRLHKNAQNNHAKVIKDLAPKITSCLMKA